jgi:putative transposase
MRYEPERHHRQSIRLKGYDYRQVGAYFITICTQEKACLFGEVVNGEMKLNDAGRIVEHCWLEIPHHFPHVALDAFVVMPNHVHGILWIVVDIRNTSPPQPTLQSPAMQSPSKTIGSIVRGFKIGVTKWFRQNTDIYTVWQRNYYEHIIRNDKSLTRIREYIANNPQRWEFDRENPLATPK